MKIIKQPRYRQIALSLAQKITHGQLAVGDKLQARSTVAKEYDVSSETARRAIRVLVDMGIAQSHHGSGAKIISQKKAEDFIHADQETANLRSLKGDLTKAIQDQQKNFNDITHLMQAFVDQSQSYQQNNPLMPFELVLNQPSNKYGKNLSELNFWYATGTTMVGVLHEGELTISPGPYTIINQYDTLYFVGDDMAVATVRSFFFDQESTSHPYSAIAGH
ncbi:GntR family transcriptional regulator [Weissella halotolerans]|uniref:Transcriptional repressor BusR n=1 Tax=Weissella halotolerans DSM 20190 TaxID=1123500 RepID=A0A0R2FYR3_9LACO|nr:GntR family transcriptional regulator [Weissella halotolerans]KRN33631.1 transcriptional repressor BusR [Weissella halotolerans DSM 20190]